MILFIWRNFVVSVWLLIFYMVFRLGHHLLQYEDLQDVYGPFLGRVIGWPAAIGAMETMLWFKPFRDRQNGARIMAGFMGIALLLQSTLVTLLIADMYDFPVNWWNWGILLYVALSHIAFALFGRDRAY